MPTNYQRRHFIWVANACRLSLDSMRNHLFDSLQVSIVRRKPILLFDPFRDVVLLAIPSYASKFDARPAPAPFDIRNDPSVSRLSSA